MRTISMILAAIALFSLPQTVEAELSYSGSSTIGDNIIPAAARMFREKTGVNFSSIENPGSGKGMKAMIEGRVDISGASRPLKDSEKKEKIFYQVIGYDAIGIYVHKDNPVNKLTGNQLKEIFTGDIKNWLEVGGNDAPIVCITEIMGEQRGTMLVVQNIAMDGAAYRADRLEVDKPEHQVEALIKNKNGIAYVSIAFERPGIKVISIDNISAEPKNVRSGAYLLSRPLLLVTLGLPKGERKEFIDFMLSPDGQKSVAKKFVSILPGE